MGFDKLVQPASHPPGGTVNVVVGIVLGFAGVMVQIPNGRICSTVVPVIDNRVPSHIRPLHVALEGAQIVKDRQRLVVVPCVVDDLGFTRAVFQGPVDAPDKLVATKNRFSAVFL